MGSFDFTCAISKLPIGYGDKVRALLLEENQSENWWYPCTTTIQGTYDDYGRILYTEDVRTRLWQETIQQYANEVGTGDNTYHDLAVSRTSSLQDFLEAAYKDCVTVGHVYKGEPLTDTKYDKDIPGNLSITRVQKLIAPLSDKFIVDAPNHNDIRVRVHDGYTSENRPLLLDQAMELLSEFAVMHCTGSGSYADLSELVVRPKVGTKDERGIVCHVYRHDVRNARKIRMVMVREDVWQHVLSSVPDDDFAMRYNKDLEEGFQKLRELNLLERKILDKDELFTVIRLQRAASDLLGGRSEAKHLHYLQLEINRLQFTDEEWAIIAQDQMDMLRVNATLYELRTRWYPITIEGSQCGAWKDHQKYHEAMLAISTQKIKEWDEEYRDCDDND